MRYETEPSNTFFRVDVAGCRKREFVSFFLFVFCTHLHALRQASQARSAESDARLGLFGGDHGFWYLLIVFKRMYIRTSGPASNISRMNRRMKTELPNTVSCEVQSSDFLLLSNELKTHVQLEPRYP